VFRARSLHDDIMEVNTGACLGCGLCVSICPEKATVMKVR
jgi:Pyruvate/2-oxoacid:ferredoxin oxidoreductase delta subunit